MPQTHVLTADHALQRMMSLSPVNVSGNMPGPDAKQEVSMITLDGVGSNSLIFFTPIKSAVFNVEELERKLFFVTDEGIDF